jgi:hypothetical protein
MALKLLIKPQTQAQASAPKIWVEPHQKTQVELLVHEYLELYRQFEAINGKQVVKRMEEIKKTLQTYANETMDGKKPALLTCEDGELEITERGTATVVKNPYLLVQTLEQKFGSEVAFSVVDIALTPLRKILSEFELKPHLEEKPGARTLKSVRPVPVTSD